ncbi:hypothetical protein [Pseudoflavitalea sp. G-6-1-2]|uniref:hypothetical protein n=1 Tax=Pseudoflavitalea sp. G-6-1-2 TaxID=2728841 RepID=UPI001F104537|nr:hypothetical protein [Pseudoflavitalea sp. G-6-1-2]
MTARILILFVLLACCQSQLYSQQPIPGRPISNLRTKKVSTRTPKVQLDSLSLIPNTVYIAGIPDSAYTIDFINSTLTWHGRFILDSLYIRYRVFPTRMNAVVNRMEYDSVMNRFIGQAYSPNFAGVQQTDNFFSFGNINYNGSFGRSISFGNSQDAVVTSNLNLQLSGYLADSIEIAAAITDNNIPIQPDGTTQQLNEFDKIFLQFKKRNWALSLGDIDIREQQNYFLSFYKRLQGIAFETTSQISSNITNKAMVSGSIAKGKFTRDILEPLEGNQGPYRLKGANNEFFFIVLANTERVFIDGELLQRGEDQDYVINYNTAEITFTPRRMITKDKRIQVEFEYADRNYLNSNIYLADELSIKDKVKVKLAFFNNADAKSSPINQTLDPAQKKFLNNLGDSITRAFYPNSSIDTFAVGKILYKKVDTVFTGGRDSIYIYSTNKDSAKYSLSFIDVGQGKGNYLPDFNGANGKVYRWVQPVNGQPQGQYEAAVFLVTPKKLQVMSLGVDYAVSKNTEVNTEVAMSNYNVNTFSSKDKADDKGYAAKASIKNTIPLRGKNGLALTSNAGFEFVESRFKPLERLRNIEFGRDWGLPIIPTPANESIITAGLAITDNKINSLKYQFTNYNRGGDFTGIRNSIYHTQDLKGWKFNNVLMLSNVNATDVKGVFLRPTFDVSRTFKKLHNYWIGLNYAIEHTSIKNKVTDTLTPQSFSFKNFTATIKSDISKANQWGVIYTTRTNQYPLGKDLVTSDRGQSVNVFTELLRNERHQFRFNGTYRILQILNDKVTTQKADKSLLGRAEYLFNEWKGLAIGSVLYEVGSGQEQKRDFAYLEVPAGQGEYTWIDYNNDGIQQLNEFEVARFQDQAKYIRILTPTNDFIKANYNTINYTVALNPRAVMDISKAKGFKKLLSRINLQSSLQLNKKEIAKGVVQLNPFKAPLGDTSLITLNQILINTFSFNRFSSAWGLDINNSRNNSKSLLTYGYESRKLDEWSIRGRINLTKRLLFELTGRTGINQLSTSNAKFDNRNYKIQQRSVEPSINFINGSNFRWLVGYKFMSRKNEQGAKESTSSNSLLTDIKYNILQSTSINGKFTYSNINFKSTELNPNVNSPAAYILLDGLMPGKNFLWTLDLTKRLSNNLELNIQYEGRKPGTSRIVHVGRAAIRALL